MDFVVFLQPRLVDVTQPKNGPGGDRSHPMNSGEKGGLPAGSSKQNQVHPEHVRISELSGIIVSSWRSLSHECFGCCALRSVYVGDHRRQRVIC